MAVEEIARTHYRTQVALGRRVSDALADLWARVDRGRIADSWAGLVGGAVAVVTTAQATAAGRSDAYVTDVLDEQGITPAGPAIDPDAFAGTAADGRRLDTLLYQPAITALTAIRAGRTVDEAMTAGLVELDMIARTEVADAGRVADGVAIVAQPAVGGYVRMLTLPSCSRCIILAGQTYRWNAGFERHPRCDCRHIPAAEDVAGDLRTDPTAAFESMTEVEQDRAFTRAGAEAIREGADMARVVNARRGMYEAGGRLLTSEATTKRGTGRRVRLMPEQIYREAGDDRDEALRLLRLHGYLVGDARPRRSAEPARAADPLAGVDLERLLDGELFSLWEQHADDAAASDGIGEELDRRDRDRVDLADDVEEDIAPDLDPSAAETLDALAADLDAAERVQAEEAAQAARELAIDRLIARGWEYREAYAEVYGLDSDELLRQERQAAVDADRRAGETREQAVRRQYAEWVRLQYLDAEEATRGHMLTHDAEARGVDALSLFSGPAHIARVYASEDLKAWWAENGRKTYTEFRAEVLGRASDIAEAERIRGRGNDRNFGL